METTELENCALLATDMESCGARGSTSPADTVSSSSIEISSQLQSLQVSFELLDSKYRVLEDRVHLLEQERNRDSSRIGWLEQWQQNIRNLFRFA